MTADRIAERQPFEQRNVARMRVGPEGQAWNRGQRGDGAWDEPVSLDRVPAGRSRPCGGASGERGSESGRREIGERTASFERLWGARAIEERGNAGAGRIGGDALDAKKRRRRRRSTGSRDRGRRRRCEDVDLVPVGEQRQHPVLDEATRVVARPPRIGGREDADLHGSTLAMGSVAQSPTSVDPNPSRARIRRAKARASSPSSGSASRPGRMPERQAGP